MIRGLNSGKLNSGEKAFEGLRMLISNLQWCPTIGQAWRNGSKAVFTTLYYGCLLGLLAQNAVAVDMCWTPSELRFRPGEESVAQGTENALVAVPEAPAQPLYNSTYEWHGVLRRVDLPPGKKAIALTFDLCEQPHEVAGYQGDLVDYLRNNNVRATFFAGGKWLLTHPERAKQLMSDATFEIENHSWEHRNLRLLSGAALRSEILLPQLAYNKNRDDLVNRQCLDRFGHGFAGDLIPMGMSLFRFPFGACDARSLYAVESLGLRAIQWDVSSGDPWVGETSDKMLQGVIKGVRPGSIVLFHANGRGWHTSKAIPAIVSRLREQGYEFATVSELLRTPGAKPVTSESCYDLKPGDTDKYDELARRLDKKHAAIIAALKAQKAATQGSPVHAK